MWSKLLAAFRNRSVKIGSALLAVGLLGFGIYAVLAHEVPPRSLDSAEAIKQITDSIEVGRRNTANRLSQLGFGPQVAEIVSVDGVPLNAFSSETVIETLYRRADAGVPGDGDRLLAVIYRDASKSSAAMATAEEFAFARKYSAEQLAKPFRFAPMSAIAAVRTRAPLSPAALNALTALADFYAGPHLAQARGLMLRHFKNNFTAKVFEEVLAQNTNSRDVWVDAIERGTPPPRPEAALRSMLRESMLKSAALESDRAAIEAIDQLSRELPPDLEHYVQNEDRIPSRQTQAVEASKVNKPGKVTALTMQAERLAIIAGIRGQPPSSNPPPGPAPVSPGDGPKPRPGPPSGTADSGGGSSPSGGGGSGTGGGGSPSGGGAGGTTAEKFSPAGSAAQRGAAGESYGRYTSRTFEGANPVPRPYKVAIRSARAARGVAIGGELSDETGTRPVKATWMPNARDERFGRIIIEFAGPSSGRPTIAASRVMFADSFYSAVSTLWGNHGPQAKFQEGHLLILMSMDPDHDLAPQERARLNREWDNLRIEYLAAARLNDEQEKQAIEARAREIRKEQQKLPRAIVTHPGIVGRELAWSAARVDFWFNRIDALSSEAAIANGGKQMPDSIRNIDKTGANTWQFYERDFVISLGAAEGPARRLLVRAKGTDDIGLRSHFSVSMFAIGGRPSSDAELVEDGVYRLPKLEQKMQPMLDWLATNHHDFMRVNDFSESFSILRWLRSNDVRVGVVNLTGQPNPIATPDRVVIGEGPKTK
jgi:uncharacterized membrane protein YgcG